MANRFWVGGTGTWDSSSTTHWSATDGGSSGASAPGASDDAIFNGNSGGGTVTVNWSGGTVSVLSINCTGHTGTLDFSANNNNVNVNGSTGFNCGGNTVHTINFGSGTFTLTSSGSTVCSLNSTGANLTVNAGTSVILLTGNFTGTRTFSTGAKTWATVTIDSNSSTGATQISTTSGTIGTLNINAPNMVNFGSGAIALTITNAFTWSGTIASPIGLEGGNTNNQSAITVTSGTCSITGASIRDLSFTGGATFTAKNSFSIGNNSGITITPPEMTRARGWSEFA